MRRGATVVAAVLLAWPGAASAATLTVTTNADSGAGSLRAALAASGPGDTIVFAEAVRGQTITLASTLVLDHDVTVRGTRAGTPGPTLTGSVTLIRVDAGADVELEGLRIAAAHAPNGTAAGSGNGGHAGANVVENAGTLTLTRLLVENSSAGHGSYAGGGGWGGGGGGGGSIVANRGTLTVAASRLTGNTAGNGASGGPGGGGGGGAIVASTGTLVIDRSTLDANTAGNGGGTLYGGSGAGGGIVATLGTATITYSTLTGNAGGTGGGPRSIGCAANVYAGGGGDGGGGGGCALGGATGGGGGGFGGGGGGSGATGSGGTGFFGNGGSGAVDNRGGGGGGGGASGGNGTGSNGGSGGGPFGGAGGSAGSVAGRGGTGGGSGSGPSGGGAGVGGGSGGAGAGGGAIVGFTGGLTLDHVTIAGNTAGGSGSGATTPAGGLVTWRAAATVDDSILAGNTGTNPDCAGVATPLLSYSLVGATTGCSLNGASAHNLLDVSAALDALADNGGPTPTMFPQALSPAIDAADTGHATDQRGAPFAGQAAAGFDMGAVEAQPVGGLRLVVHTAGVTDPARWDLEVAGTATLTDAAEGADSGLRPWPDGSRLLTIAATGGTTADDYAASVECRDADGAGSVVAAGGGLTPLAVPVAPGEQTRCTVRLARRLAVTADAQHIVYGTALPTLTRSVTGLLPGHTLADVAGTLACEAQGATATPRVGTYVVVCSGLVDARYAVSNLAALLTVDRAPLTIRADDQTGTAGQPLPALTATATGFVGADTLDGLAGTLVCNTPVAATTAAGTYPITCSGKTSGDYDIAYAPGTLTVAAKPVPPVAPPSTPPVTPPAAEAHAVRLDLHRLLVVGAKATTTSATCVLDQAVLAGCDVTLTAKIGGKRVTLARGSGTAAPGSSSVVVTIPLDARTRMLARRPGGLAATLTASAAQTGSSALLQTSIALRLLPRAVLAAASNGMFKPGQATLPRTGTPLLHELRDLVVGARRLTCTGRADDGGSAAANRRLGLDRARAVCGFLTRGTTIRADVRSAGTGTRSVAVGVTY